jgi:hypothetical protein
MATTEPDVPADGNTIYQWDTEVQIAQINANVSAGNNADRLTFDYQKLLDDVAIQEGGQAYAYNGITYRANLDYQGIVYQVDHQFNREVAVANIDAASRNLASQNSLTGTKYSADQQYTSSIYDANQRYAGQVYTSNNQLAGDEYQADKGYASTVATQQGENTRLATKLAYADARLAEFAPLITQTVNQGVGGTYTTPNLSFDAPFISSSGYYSAGDIQAQVNATLARNDSRTASQVRQMQGDLAGRGFSSNSPLASMLTVGLFGQNLQANSESERETRFAASKQNGDAVFQAQQLLQQQFNQQQQAAIDDARNQVTRQVGFTSAIAQLIGGLV